MKERIKSVDQLKLNLLAGENNKGLLAAKGELGRDLRYSTIS